MGGWEIYCALCGGPFSSRVDMDPEGRDENSYRYEVLRDCDFGWLANLRALGVNTEAHGKDKSFLTGIGHYWDYGSIEVPAGDDPNVPIGVGTGETISMTAYHDFVETPEPHVFPFHPICYEDILQRCIRQESTQKIRGDVLFNVFEELNEHHRYVRLQLSYGEPEPPAEQVWSQTRGHEVLVVNPVKIPQLEADLAGIKDLLDNKAEGSGQSPQSQDPFGQLPVELRSQIFELLSAGSILSLKAASWVMHATALSDSVWNKKLKAEMPWLWEIHDIDFFRSQVLEAKGSKLLLDISIKSQYTEENDDYIFGLANRRRIWGVCEQIRSRYLEKLEALS